MCFCKMWVKGNLYQNFCFGVMKLAWKMWASPEQEKVVKRSSELSFDLKSDAIPGEKDEVVKRDLLFRLVSFHGTWGSPVLADNFS